METAEQEEKHDLREVYLEQRRALSAADLLRSRAAVRAAALERVRATGWRRVAAYVPLRTEPGSVQLLDELVAAGVAVIVPLVLSDRDLDWVTWSAGAAGSSGLGVGAITEVDAALVPALAVADDGTRLGRGGGSYDRALIRVGSGVPIAALLHDGERPHHLPADTWDRPVTAAVTPGGWAELTE